MNARALAVYNDGMMTLEAADGARELAKQARYGARTLVAGVSGMHRETRSARYLGDGFVVGASVFQTPGGVQAELEQINSDMLMFSREITDDVERRGYPQKQDAVTEFFSSVWSPFIQEWQAWYAKHSGWWGNLWWNHAPQGEQFLAQLVQLREQAKALGMGVASPDPKQPARGLLDPLTDPLEKFLAWLFGVVKIIVYGGLIVVGGFALFAAWRHVKELSA